MKKYLFLLLFIVACQASPNSATYNKGMLTYLPLGIGGYAGLESRYNIISYRDASMVEIIDANSDQMERVILLYSEKLDRPSYPTEPQEFFAFYKKNFNVAGGEFETKFMNNTKQKSVSQTLDTSKNTACVIDIYEPTIVDYKDAANSRVDRNKNLKHHNTAHIMCIHPEKTNLRTNVVLTTNTENPLSLEQFRAQVMEFYRGFRFYPIDSFEKRAVMSSGDKAWVIQ